MRNKIDHLIDLHKKTEISGYSNAMFLLAYNAGLDLGDEQLILIFQKAFVTSRKAVKENKPLFVECLLSTLNRRNKESPFPFKDFDISKVKIVTEARFANYSFPKEIQYVEIPDFYQCKQLMQKLQSLFEETYSLYKSKKLALKSNKTSDELEIARKKKNENRYKILLKDKKLTQKEYEILLKYINESKD